MRALHLSDLHVAACALRGLPRQAQLDRMAALLVRADTADRFRKRLRQAHPRFGSGTLASAIGPVRAPDRCDLAYLQALSCVVSVLIAQKQDN